MIINKLRMIMIFLLLKKKILKLLNILGLNIIHKESIL